jgi:hypothetical protein
MVPLASILVCAHEYVDGVGEMADIDAQALPTLASPTMRAAMSRSVCMDPDAQIPPTDLPQLPTSRVATPPHHSSPSPTRSV